MKSKPLSKLHAMLGQDDTDSSEMIAQEMMADGLSGNPDEDTWLLNSRIDQHCFEIHHRARHAQYGLVA